MDENDKIKELSLIDQYLKRQLSEEEVEEFDKKILSDTNFREDFKQTQKMYKDLEDLRAQNLMKEALKKINAEEKKRIIGIPLRILQKSLSIGIATCLLIGLFLINSTVNLPDTENDINVLRQIDTNDLSDEERKVYKTFFDGQAHFVSGEYLTASMDFEKVLKISDLREYFKEAAEWHLVLSYYKSNQPKKAEKLYESLRDCDDCEYQVAWLDRLKIWSQIQWQKLKG